MSQLEALHANWGEVRDNLLTTASHEPPPTSTSGNGRATQESWQVVIDESLARWLADPSCLEDEGIVPPSVETIHHACKIALALRDEGLLAPKRIVPNGEGGIVFERRAGSLFEAIELDADGSLEVA